MSLRIGLVGCGRWGRLILRDLVALGAQVQVACRTEATAEHARKAGALAAGTALPDDQDAYVVATPTITHAAILDQLVGRGRPIFVEKPLTADVASARRLAAAAPSTLFVMDKWRYHPGIEAMRQAALAGELGDVVCLRASRWQWSSPHVDVSPLWILAPHDLSIAMHVLGRIPPLIDAFPMVAGRPELGLVARLGDERTQVVIDIGVTSTEHRRRVSVIGSQATLELADAYDDRLLVRRGPPGDAAAVDEERPLATEMPLMAELRAFLAHIRGEGPPPMSSAAEGLAIVERLAEIDAAVRR